MVSHLLLNMRIFIMSLLMGMVALPPMFARMDTYLSQLAMCTVLKIANSRMHRFVIAPLYIVFVVVLPLIALSDIYSGHS